MKKTVRLVRRALARFTVQTTVPVVGADGSTSRSVEIVIKEGGAGSSAPTDEANTGASDFTAELAAVHDWLVNAPWAETAMQHCGDYLITRFVEQHTGVFVSNAAVFLAALRCGYKPVRLEHAARGVRFTKSE